jgi:hypothetical protein
MAARTGGQAAARTAAGQTSKTRTRAPKEQPLQTLAEATGARPSLVVVPEGEEWDDAKIAQEQEKKQTRSFRIRVVDLERMQAALAGIQAKTYGTPLEGRAPRSLGDLLGEGLEVLFTHYENLLNDGNEFPRGNVSLRPGPVPGTGQQRATRSDARVQRSGSVRAGASSH